jgi:spore coat polysaccharide biosynthesis protein SpsF (cytidylyltransferase family)
MLWHIVDRLRRAPGVARVIVATTSAEGDAPLRAFCAEQDIECFPGNELDVLDRYYRAALHYNADPILRITADCPFVDPELVGRVLATYHGGGYDYVAAATGGAAFRSDGNKFPDGLDVECFSLAALRRAHEETKVRSDREHVTPYLYRTPGRFRVGLVYSEEDHASLRWTVDHAGDLELVRRVYGALYHPGQPFGMKDILTYVALHPELKRLNEAFVGHEGYEKVWNPDG